jgi:hypothetical protein
LGDFNHIAKLLIFAGVFIAVAGLILLFLGKIANIGRLPGDIFIKKGNFTFYFPLATSILLSIILTIVVNLLFRR